MKKHQIEHVLALSSVAALAATASSFAAPQPKMTPAQKTPIIIQQCFITAPSHFSKTASGTQIDYVNGGYKPATSVTFLVGYRNAAHNFLRRVTDDGTFSPGKLISHHFSLYSDTTYGGAQTTLCMPIHVRWSDGTDWTAQMPAGTQNMEGQ